MKEVFYFQGIAWIDFLGKALHLNYQFKEAISAYENFMRFADAKVIAKTDARREVDDLSGYIARIKAKT